MPQIPESETLPSLVVMADRELAVPLARLASAYSQARHVSVSSVYAAPEEMVDAIADGDPADLTLSSYPGLTALLRGRTMVAAEAATDLGQRRLVLVAAQGWWQQVAPARWPLVFRRGSGLPIWVRALPDTRLVIGEPTRVASGRHAADLLQRMRWQIPLASRTIYTPATAVTLQRLTQPGMIGIVYASDVAEMPGVEIISEIAPDIQPSARLEGNVVAGPHRAEARQFLTYLKSRLDPAPKTPRPVPKPTLDKPLR